MLNDGGRWWFQGVHGLGRMLATIGLLGFDALGVHFACVVELGDVEPSLGSMHGLLALNNLTGQLKKGAVERPIWCCWIC